MKLLFSGLLLILSLSAISQSHSDSLQDQLLHATADSSKMQITLQLAIYYTFYQADSAIHYARQSIAIADKLKDNYTKFKCLNCVLFANNSWGNYSGALKIAFQMKRIAEQLPIHRLINLSLSYETIGLINREMGFYQDASDNLHQSISLQEQSLDERFTITGTNTSAYSQLALVFLKKKQMDSALIYAQKGVDLDASIHKRNSLNLAIMGNVQQDLGNYSLAEKYYRDAIDILRQFRYIEARIYNNLASLYLVRKLSDSCLHYALASLQICKKNNYVNYALDANAIIVRLYESLHNSDSAFKYVKLMMEAKDTLFSQQNSLQVGMLNFDEKQRQFEIDAAREKYQNQIRTIALGAALGIFLLIAFILFRNNRLQKKAKSQIEDAYKELKSTQAQLIQSEKMASLGELTAGIAHEIQNPLNFVNNFSEVNNELLSEMNEEMDKGNMAGAKSIAKDVMGNGQKILTHGKRADAIVKGMLQHSRESKGLKEPTDLNALADEYLRLSYQGLRAKDKSFNVSLHTDFDKNTGRISIIPQDFGRVLLNLYNNAFYAVSEKKKKEIGRYEPTVWVSTNKTERKIEIIVKDNGDGIPQKVVDKIFQPFFTTKPAGQGTGLGLSLSYDIVKAHGGEIKVETREGEGAAFNIQLPVA